MATLSTRVTKMFMRAWRAYGQPTLTAVRPIADWNMPTGFAYDNDIDRIANSSHVVLNNPEDYWVTDTVYIVPAQNPNELRSLVAIGVYPPGTVEVGVLSTDADTVADAHAIQIDGQWYDVADVETGLQAGYRRVRLTRRV